MATHPFKMLIALVVLLLAPIVTTSCNKQFAGRPTQQKELVFEMQRTRCMGACPAYTLAVWSNGEVDYTGKAFVEPLGGHQGQITQEQLNTLIGQFEAARFFEFEPVYTARVSDLPTTYIRFKYGGNDQKITDYYGAPAELKQLEQALEALVTSVKWQPAQAE